MKTTTIESTEENLSCKIIPGGPVIAKKGPLVVWKLERKTQRQTTQGNRKYKPSILKTDIKTGVGWEKKIFSKNPNFLAQVEHIDNQGRHTHAKGKLVLIQENRWDEFLNFIVKNNIWSTDCPSYNFIVEDTDAWELVNSGLPLKAINLYSYAHLIFDVNGLPLPQCVKFDYIDGNINNRDYDLEAIVQTIRSRDDITISKQRNNNPISPIPYYNRTETRWNQVEFYWHPNPEDYRAAWLKTLTNFPINDNSLLNNPWPSPPAFSFRKAILETIFGIYESPET